MMMSIEMKDINSQPTGLFGTLDGGASCMVLGHDTLTHYIEHYHKLGYQTDHYLFQPTSKRLQFGGDRTLEAQWTVHMPVCVEGNYGRAQTYVVPGATPLLIGRPILKALKIHLNYIDDTVKVADGEWKPIVMGARKEHLLRLDDDLTSEKLAGPYDFDYVLEETYNTWTQRQDSTPTAPEPYNLWHYIEHTGLTTRPPTGGSFARQSTDRPTGDNKRQQ